MLILLFLKKSGLSDNVFCVLAISVGKISERIDLIANDTVSYIYMYTLSI